ncbi:MAG: Na+/H+ antiporter NhaA [gamma proteobacterium symbiont of Bathyaustriella thionipta]|nr:Na+/H+ antiporter NhaA [gamma proteobacterium symbiont of Bathyaustriella thionipta]
MPEKRNYYAPWERAYQRISTPFEEFLHQQTTTGILLIACALTALFIANSPLSVPYDKLLHMPIVFSVGNWSISHSVHHWINDGLMTIFFFVVGLEIKREVLFGELSSLKNAALPIVAAMGGMLVPALFYWMINPEGLAARGWGIPMATDIAFVVGVAALLGNRIPKSLVTFLVALAIVDDLGAVTVIAVFYTDTIAVNYLLAAAFFTGLLLMVNYLGIRNSTPYFLISVFLWIAMEGSGVHATIAGIIGALSVPAYSRYKPRDMEQKIRTILNEIRDSDDVNSNVINSPQQTRRFWHIARILKLSVSPLQRFETRFHVPSTFMVIPIFALANAAIPLDTASITAAAANPVALGIAAGLILGKTLGVAGSVLLAWKLGLGNLPQGTSPSHIIGAGMLAGIGFTMSIFVSELAFVWDKETIVIAKMGILFASLIAGVGGYSWLRWVAAHQSPQPAG